MLPLSKRLLLLAILAMLSLTGLGMRTSPAAAAVQPWWQILTGSRPTNLWEPTDNVQEITTGSKEVLGSPVGAVELKVGGELVGCLGTTNFFGTIFCENFTGFAPTETAAQLEAVLEDAFGTPLVEVTGGPFAGDPFLVTVPTRAEPNITVKPIENEVFGPLGSATAKVLENGGSGRLTITVTNLGDAEADGSSTPITIVDELPEGVEAAGFEAFAGAKGEAGPVDCSVEAANEISCTFGHTLPPYEAIEVEVLANLTGSPPAAGAPGKVTVSGGNAPAASAPQTVKVSPDPTPFGIEQFSARPEEEGGGLTAHAGAHPFQLTTTIQLNANALNGGNRRDALIEQPAQPRNLTFSLPTGLVGNASAMDQCPMETFLTLTPNTVINDCSDSSAVGVSAVTIIESGSFGLVRMAVPVFNLVPGPGEPARFGFMAVGTPVVIDTAVDPDNEYRITASVRNVSQVAEFLSSTVALWGAPSDPRHDNARGWNCAFYLAQGPCLRPDALADSAFLRQPVSCVTPVDFGVTLEPWNVPAGSVVETAASSLPHMVGCNQVPFDPSILASPTSSGAGTPTGLDFHLDMPNSGLLDPKAKASEGQAKKVEVTLPEGMTINPSQAEGLATCSPADYAAERFDSQSGEGCPQAAKIGEVNIATPLLKEEAHGSLYVAAPYDNPFGSLLAVYLVAKIPERGILVKQAGRVEPDPETGQLVTTFDDLPQLPFSSFKLHFREGGRAPLVTPERCGTYQVEARFTPWSAADPDNPTPQEIVSKTSSFSIDHGGDGGPCPSGNSPFRPTFEAGSANPAAGHYSPFYMRLTRNDGDQDLTKFSSVLPEGALAKLAGVTKCPQASVEAAKGKTGLEEKATPSCPPSSQIGSTNVGAGVGSILTYVPGQLYLGGPYHGSPLSVVSITPAVAGPFDIGTVVVQEALDLDPSTSEVHVNGARSDPIPHILEGIPLKVRDLRVYVNRPNFTTTPTSCDPMATKATLFGSGLDVFSPVDDTSVDLSSRYQAASCESLGFKPRVQIRLTAKRSTRGAYPRLRAVLRPRLGDANPEQISVTLPGSELLEQGHIRTICTRVQFAAGAGFGAGCPQRSIYGHVKAWTPLLDEPLEGPVYLRSSNHELPDMVLALHGLVNIESVGRIDSVNARIRTTFENVPDAPLSKVVLNMQGGDKGLLTNSTDVCRGVHRAKGVLEGQNGKVYRTTPKVTANCRGRTRPPVKRSTAS